MSTRYGFCIVPILLSCTFAHFALAETGNLGGIRFNYPDGTCVMINTIAEPPFPALTFEDWPIHHAGSGPFNNDNTIHRAFWDVNGLYYGYDLTIDRIEDTQQYRVSFGPLTRNLIELHQGIQIENPEYPQPQIIEDGDTIVLDMFVDPKTQRIISDHILISSREIPFETNASPTPLRDLELNDSPFDRMNQYLSIVSTETDPPPILSIIVKRNPGSESGIVSGAGKYQWIGISARDVFSEVYGIPSIFIEGNAVKENTRYDVSAVGPSSENEALKKELQTLLEIAFQVTAKKETHDTEGWILMASKGKPKQLKATATSAGSSEVGRGQLTIAGMGMEQLVRSMQHVLQKPVIDRTGIDGRFDLSLQYEDGRPESLLEALKEIGFSFEEAKIPIEFLVVNKK
jgi:uncharacterized protein (TIGR03435 family)